MANRIKMAVEQSIMVLDERGWSYRRIARELGIHRETVSRYVHLARAGPEPAEVLRRHRDWNGEKKISGSASCREQPLTHVLAN